MKLHLGLLLLLAFLAVPAKAEIVVIVHPESPLKSLSAKEVSDLYLGRNKIINGERIVVLDLTGSHPLRASFFHLLNGMDLSRLNAYWARLQFSGDTQPPPQLNSPQAVAETVSRNRMAIGYVYAAQVTQSVHALLKLKE